MKSAQQAQQDAELAAAKHYVATRLAAHQEFAQVRPALNLRLCIARLWVTHIEPSTETCLWCLVKSGKGHY